MARTPARAELVRRLAVALRSQVAPGAGVSPEPAAGELSEADRLRGEQIVRELEELGLYPRGRASRLAEALRHPVVVGALVALLSGVFASMLIPSLTRVWQDRPRELALKRELVARISREATEAADGAVRGLQLARGRRAAFFDRLVSRWRLESSVVGSELATYFPNSEAMRRWRRYMGAMNSLLQGVAFQGEQAAGDSILRDHFRAVRFGDAATEGIRQDFVHGEHHVEGPLTQVNVLMLEERDQITADVVASDAVGFSHGFWIFR
jgi:hypothetical protein